LYLKTAIVGKNDNTLPLTEMDIYSLKGEKYPIYRNSLAHSDLGVNTNRELLMLSMTNAGLTNESTH
jgi:hypothetical protein